MLEGGDHINGSLLSAGLIDEISIFALPLADGTAGTPKQHLKLVGSSKATELMS